MSNQAQQTAQPSTVRATPVVSTSQEEMGTPGVQVEYTADQAEANGAFRETALSEGDAWAANADLAADPNGTAIVVGRKPVKQAAERKPEGQ